MEDPTEETALAREWLECLRTWWEMPWPEELTRATGHAVTRTHTLLSRCAVRPRRVVTDCLAAEPAREDALPVLLMAWSLHEAELIPLHEWLAALSDQDCVSWGTALRSLHARSERHTAHAAPLQPILRELGAVQLLSIDAQGARIELVRAAERGRWAAGGRAAAGEHSRTCSSA